MTDFFQIFNLLQNIIKKKSNSTLSIELLIYKKLTIYLSNFSPAILPATDNTDKINGKNKPNITFNPADELANSVTVVPHQLIAKIITKTFNTA